MPTLKSIEICAGAGGQALGLERAGFMHEALVELDPAACRTLRYNRKHWNVIQKDVREFSARGHAAVDLLAGGVPCPPFSIAGKQLGEHDERDLFPEVLRLAQECSPRAIMIENVKGLLSPKFETYRNDLIKQLELLGYVAEWKLLHASDYGVPQLRPRAILVALRPNYWGRFSWPQPGLTPAPTVGEVLHREMASRGWENAEHWRSVANKIAPTLVGGSRKHGGPDLGPTRARRAWAELGVNGLSLADAPPPPGFEGPPRLTVRMAAILQGFPREWEFVGTKTAAYRQVGNAFPPPVAEAVGKALVRALDSAGAESDKAIA